MQALLCLKKVSAHMPARANQRRKTGGTTKVSDSLLTPALSRARCRCSRMSGLQPDRQPANAVDAGPLRRSHTWRDIPPWQPSILINNYDHGGGNEESL